MLWARFLTGNYPTRPHSVPLDEIASRYHRVIQEMMSTENSANDKGLVSIICRTIGRPELQLALQSVSSQSYSDIEIVLVDAASKDLSGYEAYTGNIPVILVSTGKPLGRSAAANAGLQAASGKYLMFLDDDDWIADDHVQSLIEFLAS